jgi:hypothetical protein
LEGEGGYLLAVKFFFFFCVSKVFLKKFKKILFFFCFKLIFFWVFLDHFNALMSKIIFFKINKYYFDAFPNEKYFEKQPQLHSKTRFDKNSLQRSK